MADVRITDLVDPQAIADLRTVKSEIAEVKDIYLEVIRATATAIKVKVETVGDIEKINTIVAGGMQKARKRLLKMEEDNRTRAFSTWLGAS